ncbi:NAD(P)/FAD-dependent oxidoreductase [Salinisphaera orenii]|uniref:FAD-dependent oxidoreductase n=1 Tax=Salinisphaera orenii YIM 95161 TaxID=1051139 RepID=A0A423PE63_9GAMM|nr:FAD-dependent oxidoreductase [Salinisphaera halophila YIM 95161]
MGSTQREARALTEWLAAFETALGNNDVDAVSALFADDCYWRDLVVFTWNIKTLEGRDSIRDMLGAMLGNVRPHDFTIDGEATELEGVVEGWFTFNTGVAHAQGHVRLINGKAWTLLTAITDLVDHPEATGHHRPLGTVHRIEPERPNWLERQKEHQARLGHSEQPYCVIVGGGQAGIALAARLKQLDVPTLVVERNERAGDSWRNRYRSLCLHDPVWYDHLPYIRFPENWPVFTPKDKMGDWLEMYTKVMELDYWSATECKSAQYDETREEWRVDVEFTGDGERQTHTLRPKHLIMATGALGMPNVPEIPGASDFNGTLHHSSEHPGGQGYAGKRCIVLGANNSAHDIAADLWANGADVTMIQRSSTHVVKSDSFCELSLGALYSQEATENGLDVDQADMLFASTPYAVLPQMAGGMGALLRERDADFYERLEQTGFVLDFGGDDTGLLMKALRRGGGYYIDVGASELLIEGKIGLRSRVSIDHIKSDSVVLTDGEELPADVIILATGYGSMNNFAAELISQEVADRVGKCWGLGSDTPKDPGPWEGELRNMWKPTQQPGLWFHSGNLHLSRHYSRYLALQLKARMEGIDTPVYGIPEVHHLE